ncbi:hypothetical protein [Oligoflexus tunisiensis]|uniref:hypothetical protein n=1 Tax=Oligoflexus tunisiensis TaxID=708132 RepID=UPI00114CDA14|nr:hypothetical protein [Oligoflexus tunisiensis]
MLKLFWADLRQLKKPIILLVLMIPLLHYLDNLLFPYAVPLTVNVTDGQEVIAVRGSLVNLSGWPFALMASIILLLFTEEMHGNGRLSSLASLPLDRWKLGLLRHLPALVLMPILGLLLNAWRFILYAFYAVSKSDLWVQSHSINGKTLMDALVWAFHQVTNPYDIGYASIFLLLAGWASVSLLILGLPLLIDDLWPGIKRSSFSLWLSVSLLVGLVLQVAVFGLGKGLELPLFPYSELPMNLVLHGPTWQPSLWTIELVLGLGIFLLELWRFQKRSVYV